MDPRFTNNKIQDEIEQQINNKNCVLQNSGDDGEQDYPLLFISR
jgi:hypothetical protein